MAQWFYEKDGKPTGPVSQLEIARLIISGRVKEDTFVWTQSFGDNWRRADEAGLPRVVSRKVSGAEKGAEAEATAMIATSFLEALEKKQASLSSIWAIALFAVPFFVSILASMLLVNVDINAGTAVHYLIEQLLLLAILVALQVLIIQKDRKAMASAGYRPLSYWWILLPQGYFLLRWERTRKYLGLFLVSTAILVVGIVEVCIPTMQAQVAQIQKNMSVASALSTPQSQNNQGIATPKKAETKK